MTFSSLHCQPEPLLIANVWDVASAQIAQQAGYSVIGTSSAAIASILGYADGEGVSFIELERLVRRIRTLCSLPLTVDMEAGYGKNVQQIITNLSELAELGVVGINLEDSVVEQGQRRMLDVDTFSARLQAIRNGLIEGGISLFLNIRTDTFLLGHPDALAETITRGCKYALHGADGFFVPCVTKETDISSIVEQVPLPLNVMCMPELPSFSKLAKLGVKRISMGNFIHGNQQQQLLKMLQTIQCEQSFQIVFSPIEH
jgi:2-methylisocitrate lyase-like PEP mutase family enzyme